LCRTVEKYDILFKDEYAWKKEKVLQSRTVREFDSHFTSIHFGFENVEKYYAKATMHNKLHKIKTPTLCLSAGDDPFQPIHAIPIKEAEYSSHVAIIVTARGGHIGFLEGFIPTKRDQYMARIFTQYFEAALFDKDGEFEGTKKLIENMPSVK
jgi:abhydrolase domain-containing protein 1/3